MHMMINTKKNSDWTWLKTRLLLNTVSNLYKLFNLSFDLSVFTYIYIIYGTIGVWHSSLHMIELARATGWLVGWLVGRQPADSPLEWNFQIPSHSWLAGAWQPAASLPACHSVCLLHALINMKVGRCLSYSLTHSSSMAFTEKHYAKCELQLESLLLKYYHTCVHTDSFLFLQLGRYAVADQLSHLKRR